MLEPRREAHNREHRMLARNLEDRGVCDEQPEQILQKHYSLLPTFGSTVNKQCADKNILLLAKGTIMRLKAVSLMKLLIKEQTLFTIMGRMLAVNWKPWAVSRLVLIQGGRAIKGLQSKMEGRIECGGRRASWMGNHHPEANDFDVVVTEASMGEGLRRRRCRFAEPLRCTKLHPPQHCVG
jgi:hypothetical protein